MKNGGKSFTVASKEDVLQHAKKYSKTYDSKSDSFNGPWQSEFGEMAKKTACIQLLKYAPKSIELALAQSSDNKVLEASPNGITYVDEETGEVKEMTEIQEGNGNNE